MSYLPRLTIYMVSAILLIVIATKVLFGDKKELGAEAQNPIASESALSRFDEQKDQDELTGRKTETGLEYSGSGAGIYECDGRCRSQIDTLISEMLIEDEELAAFMVNSEELAAYLRHHPDKQQELVQIAASTMDGNLRSILLRVFSFLDIPVQQDLALSLAQARSQQQRREGALFLTGSEALDDSLADELSYLLAVESERYVKTSLINALNDAEKFRGNQTVLDSLYGLIQADMNDHVRGKALLASANLLKNPEEILHEAVLAIESDSEDYQLYGLRTFSAVLKRNASENTDLGWLQQETVQGILYELIHSSPKNTSPLISQQARSIFVNNGVAATGVR